MAGGPDYLDKWCAATDRKLDMLNDKLDNLQAQTIDLWQKNYDEIEKVRQEVRVIQSEHGQKLASHSTELSTWRWALLICFGMIITAVMQATITRHMPMQPPPLSQTIDR